MRFMLRVKFVKEKRMKKWMNRADYEATLKVVDKSKDEVLDDQFNHDDGELINQFGTIIKIDDYLNRTDQVVREYVQIKQKNAQKRKYLEELLKKKQ